MNCEQVRPVLLDYVMDEVPAGDRAAIHRHLETCAACSEEAGKCRQTLSHLAQGAAFDEIPQRIRVVTEPASVSGNWWVDFWRAPARLAFAASGLACLAIAVLALARTTITYQQGDFEIAFGSRTAAGIPAAATVPATPAAAQELTREEIAQWIAEAVAASDARQSGNTARIVNAAVQQAEERRLNDRLEIAETLRYFDATQVNMWKNQQVVTALLQRPPAIVPDAQ